MFISKIFIIFFILIQMAYSQGLEGVYTLVVQKQAQKAQTRWTLTDWLGTKKKMALMDQWLALNTSAHIFEMYFGGGERHYDLSQATSPEKIEHLSKNYYGAFYVSIFGLEYKRDKSIGFFKQDEIQFNLRVLGTSTQVTNLTFHYGQRKLKDDRYGIFEQNYFGGVANLYLLSFFGLEGLYRTYNNANGSDGRYSTKGRRVEYGAFLEVFFFRFYINLFREKIRLQSFSLGDDEELREGVDLGGRIHF